MVEKEKIIIIEDGTGHTDLITDIFEEDDDGKEIVLARDGMEAIDCFQNLDFKYDGQLKNIVKLIILDLNIPKISGMDILKFLKKNPKYSTIPVIILSTNSDKQIIKEAYKNGVDDFVVKPFSFEEFIITLKSLKEYYAA